jgi:hypothetical protein
MAAVTRTSSNNLTANENPGRNGPFRCLHLISLHPSPSPDDSPADEILQKAHMPSLPPFNIRSMFPAEFVHFFCLLCVGTGGGTAESDGFCAGAELVGLHGGQHWYRWSTEGTAMN